MAQQVHLCPFSMQASKRRTEARQQARHQMLRAALDQVLDLRTQANSTCKLSRCVPARVCDGSTSRNIGTDSGPTRAARSQPAALRLRPTTAPADR